MSWIQVAPLVRGHGDEQDVFDEEADETLLVQREWRSHMQRRVKVKLRGGRGWEEERGFVKDLGSEIRGQNDPGLARRYSPYPLLLSPALILLGFPNGLLESV